jgi:uncharacterized paraquat-inducible protein A
MYCPSCGTAAAPGLSYCKHCGAELNARGRGAMNASEVLPVSLVWAIVAITVGGIGVIIGLMAVMKEVVHFNEGLIAAFTMLSFLILLVADSVFIRLLLHSRGGAKAATETPPQRPTLRELDAAQARGLAAPASVIEHTTRTLEPGHSEKPAR